jgi:16S rRNA (cytosine967-C5)-methyltransferase
MSVFGSTAGRGRGRADAVSPARRVAYSVIRRVFEQGAYADRALGAAVNELAARDRALATQLAYGTVQRKATLDHFIAELSGRRIERLQPPVLAALRLGLFQLLFLDGVAEHAAVHESVELVKTTPGGRASGLVNAVLRRAAGSGPELLQPLGDQTPQAAALAHSVPVWLAELWWRERGPEHARALLAAVNRPAEAALRANTLVADRRQVLEELPVPARPVDELEEALVLEGPFDIHGSALWRAGAVVAQSRASMLVGHVLDPRPAQRILDLCAAPGAKTSHAAALSGGGEQLVAVEANPGRARTLAATLERMHVTTARVEVADARQPRGPGELFDRVLVDPPCSGLGTLQSRPDLRWRTSPERVRELSALQAEILRAGAAATAPDGTLVYSVCTISQAEGETVVQRFLAERPEFALEDCSSELPGGGPGPFLTTYPDRDGTDGFFVARLRRWRAR